ncbi:uncharacterized protein (DUF1330 family) [Hydrogenispora ethanolica]|uniref:Uncharacterized protein (DUF1330 family) n=1 Tax=Hydrogenispora ethanolica TaxID=1082276 RepID=A0A4V6NGY9_HYDET|nr:DUF1330 domain-containing protein [Hydrogenispora ethanolica]TCL68557.1 uncharacterized protein (DUF1330 family) [Hydrogenispora ethanolica]
MSYYFVAQIQIRDEAEYQKYLNEVDEVFSKFEGEYLAVDPNPAVIEGEWKYSRFVMIQFPDETAFQRWYQSPEYQAILRHRLRAAQCDTVLVKGL